MTFGKARLPAGSDFPSSACIYGREYIKVIEEFV